MSSKFKKVKLVCIQPLYYGFTKPYFHFQKGEFYEARILDLDSYENGYNYCYSFSFCDLIININDAERFFKTIEDWRDEQLDKII